MFAHTGWRKIEDQWFYLHAEGALGAAGLVPGVRVALPEHLSRFELVLPEDVEQLRLAVRASLRFLEVAPDSITIPLLAATFRAVLAGADFSMFLTGRTGVFKTALALLAQQHFGSRIDSASLPGNFSSTANALELVAFHAKDALLVVDDFAPSGGPRDTDVQSVAERLFRGAGNRQGRGRMGSNGRLRPQNAPRGLVLATGEDVPAGESIRARMMIVEVAPGDVDVSILTECQRAGAAGLFSQSMGAFVSWVAARYEQVQARLRARAVELRASGLATAAHARTPGIIGELQAALELFVEFAVEAGAITALEVPALQHRAAEALRVAAASQLKFQRESDPALRFLGLLRGAITAGQAHVADRRGQAPDGAERWGWRQVGNGWCPAGVRVGWVEGDDLYLESTVSYGIAEGQAGRNRLQLSERTLRVRLKQRGLLASTDAAHETLTVRRTVEGKLQDVLHLKTTDFGG